MGSAVKIRCPVHKTEITSNRTIPFGNNEKIVREPIFYCEKCDKYYVHTGMAPFGSNYDYGDKQVENTSEEVYTDDLSGDTVICTDFTRIKSYMPPFIPETCYKDHTDLKHIANGILSLDGQDRTISGFYCEKCGDIYVEDDEYDDIKLEYDSVISRLNMMGGNTSTGEHAQNIRRYTLDQIRPAVSRKKTEDICGKIRSYEECEKNYDVSYPYSLLHYAFILRRFDVAKKILDSLNPDEVKEALFFSGPPQFEWITPLVCAKWNLNYIWAFDERNKTDLAIQLSDHLHEVEHIDELMEYTEIIDKNDNDVFSVFWAADQPVLDVIYYEKQLVASKQVQKNGFSIVMDEVGTGKTVSALYAIRDLLHEMADKGRKARVLIVCPYNKRADWQNDIRRQLGRYAHIVEQGDNGKMYSGELKEIFFKNNEHIILIAGQRQGDDKEGSYSALKGSIETYSPKETWDLAIIDEAHLSFTNYSEISADKAMLMTATPIVVNAGGKRLFNDYLEMIRNITGRNVNFVIDPISKAVPDDSDGYVNWFREDMEKRSAERLIRFVACRRWSERDDVFYRIKNEKGALAALQYDQDDDYLYKAATEEYGLNNVHEPTKNGKIDKLIALLHEDRKSYIIFCEHQYVVNKVFTVLKDEFSSDVVAEKFGRYENQYGLENVQDGQLVNTLMQALRNKERVLFVTTGKTGGTGLNLGEFDGVIHYELPFTSIELEQRFGRVDRIDTVGFDEAKDMIFLLNERREDENDMEINRMLYYCTTKIDVTCQYMPIRNTVLYYPEFIERNGKAIRESLEALKQEYILSEDNEKKVREILRNIRSFENKIMKDMLWPFVKPLDKNIRLSALQALSSARDDRISESYYELLQEYLEYWKNTRSDRNAYQKMYRIFLDARKNAYNWLAIIGLVKVDKDSDVFVGHEQKEDGEEDEIKVKSETPVDPGNRSGMTVQKQISEIISLIDKCVFNDKELQSFSSEGVFCYKDGRIRRSNVNDYREGTGWN